MSLLESCYIPDWPDPANVRSLQTTRNGGDYNDVVAPADLLVIKILNIIK